MIMNMAIQFMFLWFPILSLLCFALSLANSIPRFPSSIIQPEKLSHTATNKLYKEKFFTQILDHFTFNPQSYQTFQQRYLLNNKYWGGAEKNAPIFVYTGNEGDIEWFAQNTGFLFDSAPHFKALLVFIEHRFYGKSIPFGGDKDIANSNTSTLGYLTSSQALADYATLIIDLRKNLSATDSPVVVFGGSYGGSVGFIDKIVNNYSIQKFSDIRTLTYGPRHIETFVCIGFAVLAAWFRLKYPHVAVGALASSAPILNFENITSPYSFTDIITKDFRSESENCYKVIKGSWQQIEDAASRPGGLDLLRNSFKICRNNTSAGSLEGWLETAWSYAAMTDYPTPSNFLNPMPAYPVKQMCKAIDDPTTGNDTFAKLYGAASVYYNYSGDATCFDPDDDSDPHGLGGWMWQACTEMIMPLGSNNEESIFPVSQWQYSARAKFCESYFDIEPRPNWITSEFGGHDIERVLKRYGSNIIFFNGLRDPWSGGGVLKNISKSIVAIIAEQGAHHVDLRFATPEDPKWLQDVRAREVNIIAKWLKDYYHDLAHGYS